MARGGFTAIKSALAAFLGLAFLAWILQIIGLAGLQHNCYGMATLGQTTNLATGNQANSILSTNLAITGVRGLNRSLECSDIYRYYWFMLAFQFITLVGLAVMTATGMLAAAALSLMAWLTVLTLLHIQGADTFLGIKDVNYVGFDNYVYSRLTAAGWILTAIADLGLIFLLGWRPRKLRAAAGPIKY
eukprot:GHRQ01017176.1.p1 GENE.GHRQ01017176.1~~GHRQ01017176.1.p1  ORF type:complete len:188 (-),score=58.73 GHRQ01017176.1:661-1224(-)